MPDYINQKWIFKNMYQYWCYMYSNLFSNMIFIERLKIVHGDLANIQEKNNYICISLISWEKHCVKKGNETSRRLKITQIRLRISIKSMLRDIEHACSGLQPLWFNNHMKKSHYNLINLLRGVKTWKNLPCEKGRLGSWVSWFPHL